MKKEFKEIDKLLDCDTFEELENEYENYIYYADGCEQSVLNNIEDEDYKYLSFYYFDNWHIALWN